MFTFWFGPLAGVSQKNEKYFAVGLLSDRAEFVCVRESDWGHGEVWANVVENSLRQIHYGPE